MVEGEAVGGGARVGRGPLQGLRVVVTRPAHQADTLAATLEAAGAQVIRFPALDIAEALDPRPALALVDRLETFDIVVFTSPNAVARGTALVRSRRSWPPAPRIAAVGSGTARALAELGLHAHIVPDGSYGSEGLLAQPALQHGDVEGRAVLIIRGEGGRDLIARTLSERGARVESAIVYRRVRPALDPERLLAPARRGEVDALIVTSGEALRNLFDMMDPAGRAWLRETPLVVVSERAAALAREMGVRSKPIVAARASDEALVEAVARVRSAHGSERSEP
ncbi:MAG: uroporphyrinogen-III synthase [Gammaproteobacteria bacterium]|nr:uroporphyrinogen-III synthase [Gammaproteobacteria bacterium]NIR83367.1 uroporphyrinogen-III synthase [Gammaproteobacteria bacterium]NIR91167.1 uroporphyrinogen-III synthase [Gammaproteobacteria bacterium]NIU04534.1 uroporphyrinogen-III synthase [Gammaproteobacteria bacterium]NIW87170.1 uroporphyrinogen-III synthase [Gammaproteobacteria bacterium]